MRAFGRRWGAARARPRAGSRPRPPLSARANDRMSERPFSEHRRSWLLPCSSRLGDLSGFAHARDERGPEQEFAREFRVFRLTPQLVMILLAHGGIAFGKQLLV